MYYKEVCVCVWLVCVKLSKKKVVTSLLPDSLSVVISPRASHCSQIAASKILPLL